MKNSKTLKLVQTAIFLALLIVFQYISKPMGQYVTGSLVNFTLVGSVLAVGLAGGVTVALVSPFLAFFLGIGPAFIQIIPMIALGNLVLVMVYHFIFKGAKVEAKNADMAKWLVAIAVAAVAKFATLYLGLVKIVLPMLLKNGVLKAPQVAMMSGMFSFPQLITATVGGIIAFLIMPPVLRAIEKNK
ncbi:MAG: ECF transporter S component [Oscillospiraceae bacterium]